MFVWCDVCVVRFSEDLSVFSVNVIQDGMVATSSNNMCGKLWIALHPQDGEKYIKWMEENFPDAIAQEGCHSWINHRNMSIDPMQLVEVIDQYFIHQQPRDLVITYSNTVH